MTPEEALEVVLTCPVAVACRKCEHERTKKAAPKVSTPAPNANGDIFTIPPECPRCFGRESVVSMRYVRACRVLGLPLPPRQCRWVANWAMKPRSAQTAKTSLPPPISGDCSTCYSVGILPDPEYLDACEVLGIERPQP